MTNKQKLELTWIGKDVRPRLEPRILVEDMEKSHHAAHRVTENDLFDNMLIHGDNLLALKALEQQFTEKIKCIYIDPPFNTGAAFEHYDDSVEHSLWLSLMRDRLEILRGLLAMDGSIYVHIDNRECAYLKVLMDEVFARRNFIQMISVKRASPAGFKVVNPGPLTVTDYILLYAREKECFDYIPQRVPVPYDENYNLYIANPESDPNLWEFRKLTDLLYEHHSMSGWKDARSAWGSQWKQVRQSLLGDLALTMKDQVVSVRDPHKPSDTIRQAMIKSRQFPNQVIVLERENAQPVYIYGGGSLSFYRDKLRKIDGELVPTELLTDFWGDINFAGIADEGGVQFKNGKKPEMLVRRVIETSTRPGDWVLDSFGGSGTTAAVAHKMGRRWIMVEVKEQCDTHIVPRLKRVIDGTDKSGITVATGWKGGGGFRYFELAPSLLKKDRWGQWVINTKYNDVMLTQALCKIEGFTYAPSDTIYWMQGQSTERDFLYVTTQNLSPDQLQELSDDVGADQTLLVLCSAFRGDANRWENLTVQKIPKHVLSRCEWDHDDYSLQVHNLSHSPLPPGQQSLFDLTVEGSST